MRIGILGAGPAGLFFAFLMKRREGAHDVRVVERNPRGATFGFGVVFSNRALAFLREGDAETFAVLSAAMESWPDQQIVHRDEAVRIDGNGFSSIGRLRLLQLLHGLCEEVGVRIEFDRDIGSLEIFDDCDLIVGADGINSLVRRLHADAFRPRIAHLTNKYVWYGTAQRFEYLTLTFRASEHGAFVAHHYRYAPRMSTFIVECDAATWQRAGLAHASDAESRAYCERLFAPDLGGRRLISNNSVWRNFPVVTNRNWHHGNVVLLGDALHSVHFSIGSGTRLAMEDAIALSGAFEEAGDDVPAALRRFEETRRPTVEKILAAAARSSVWYEAFGEKMDLEPYKLAYDYMTRSGRMSHPRLRETAPQFTAAYEAHRKARGSSGSPADSIEDATPQ